MLPTGASVDDLNPTIRLMHELMGKGLPRLARGADAMPGAQRYRCRLRPRLPETGQLKRTLKGELRERKTFADLQNIGQAVTEGPAALSREAHDLVEAIAAALQRAQKKERAEREARGPARLVRSTDKGREDR